MSCLQPSSSTQPKQGGDNIGEYRQLLAPDRVWSREEILARPCPAPKQPGIYAWFFRNIPPQVPIDGCIRLGDLTLLYIGIAPKAPSQHGGTSSRQRLVHRIRYHYRGNAEGSTLRLTLGSLLSAHLGIALRRVGSGHRLTFADGEANLSQWMQANAFVAWLEHPYPWVVEKQLINRLSLPLNLDMNRRHPFHPILSDIRSSARGAARGLPIWEKSVGSATQVLLPH